MLTNADLDYIRSNFVALDDLARDRGLPPEAIRREIVDGRLPKASYVLDDGTEMVPRDYLSLADEAGGVERLRHLFLSRYTAAADRERQSLETAEDEWAAYLSGEYGVCLRRVTPENVVRKSVLVQEIDGLLAGPSPSDARWRERLRHAVDELDDLEREFAPYDRIRFGGPVSRDRLITAARERYPDVFTPESVGGARH
jgi:Family of unknown function (DUF6058)